jgi:hypothetical protein
MNHIGLSIPEIIQWALANIPIVVLMFSIGSFFTIVYWVTTFLRNIKKGIAQLFTPLGGVVALVVFIIAFVFYVMIKSMITPFN